MAEIIVPPEMARIAKRLNNSAGVQRAVGKVVADSGRPVWGARPPRYASKVSTRVTTKPAGFTVVSSGELAAGAEFGGRRRPKQTYATHRKGTAYAVRRRTTMQFLPWLGAHGYAIMPAMRKGLSGVRQRILDALAQGASGD